MLKLIQRPTPFLSSLIFIFLISSPFISQSQIVLLGTLTDDAKQPLAGLEIAVSGHAGTVRTDSRGIFRFEMSAEFEGGDQVKYKINSKKWVIKYPANGVWNLAHPLRPGVHKPEVVVVRRGSPALLDHEGIMAVIRHYRDSLRHKVRLIRDLSAQGADDLQAYILKWSEARGIDRTTVDRQLQAWLDATKSSTKLAVQANRAFLLRDYRKSGSLRAAAARALEAEQKKYDQWMQIRRFNAWTEAAQDFLLAFALDSVDLALRKAEEVLVHIPDVERRITLWTLEGLHSFWRADFREMVEIYGEMLDTITGKRELEIMHLGDVFVNIGTGYDGLGRADTAIQCYEYGIGIKKEYLGETHPEIAYCYNNVAGAYASTGQFERALEYHAKAIETLEITGIEFCNGFEYAYINLSTTYALAGRFDEALDFARKSLHTVRACAADTQQVWSLSYCNMGEMHRLKGQLDSAARSLGIALQVLRHFGMERHPDAARIMLNQAYVLLQQHDPDAAMNLVEKAEKIIVESLGKMHPLYVEAELARVQVYGLRGQHEAGRRHAKKAIEISETIFGKENPVLGRATMYLGIALRELRQFRKAIETLEKAIAILQKYHPNGHVDLATAQAHLGQTQAKIGREKEGLANCAKALQYHEKVLGPYARAVAEDHVHIGMIHAKMKAHDDAIHHFDLAVSILERFRPPQDSFVTYIRWYAGLSYLGKVLELKRDDQADSALVQARVAVKYAEAVDSDILRMLGYYLEGGLLEKTKQPEAALEALNQGIVYGLRCGEEQADVVRKIKEIKVNVLRSLGRKKEARALENAMKRLQREETQE